MNTPAPTETVRPRRRLWPWVLVVLLSPFVILAVVATSILTLDSDARVLRREVMAANGGHWRTKVQFSVGGLALGTARTALSFVHCPNIAEIRLAAGSVKAASVGLYELSNDSAAWSRQKLFGDADDIMTGRGWTRMVGGSDNHDYFLIYAKDRGPNSDRMDVCLAVVDGRKLVVVSATVDANSLASAVEKLVEKNGHPLRLANAF